MNHREIRETTSSKTLYRFFLLSVKLVRVGNLKSALMRLYGNTISLPRSRTASIRHRARIISRGGTDNAQIYSKSRTDTKRKQKETGEVPPLTQCTRGACAYLHAVVTSADDTSAHFFFAHRISKRSAHTHVDKREKDDPRGGECEKDDLCTHTRALA